MSAYREILSANLREIKTRINAALSGSDLQIISPILKRIDSTGNLPSWFSQLSSTHTLPNLDGKTIGSVIEKILVCVLEKYIFKSSIELNINPAKGVDIPELELGIKSPSENFCTSEPYFSAYERLIGNEYDAIILLTDYQSSKKRTRQNAGLKLQIKDLKYLKGSEIADCHLCSLAESLKQILLKERNDECMLKRAIHFLAYVNQSDWEASCIIDMLREIVVRGGDKTAFGRKLRADFTRRNAKYEREGKSLLPETSLIRLEKALQSTDSIVLAAENWVTRNLNENWHSPSATVWNRIVSKPLEGKIGMSFALQWRYNFGPIFKNAPEFALGI